MNTPIGIALHKYVGVRFRANERAKYYRAVKEAMSLLEYKLGCSASVDIALIPTDGSHYQLLYGSREKGITIHLSNMGRLFLWVSPNKRFVYGSQQKPSSS